MTKPFSEFHGDWLERWKDGTTNKHMPSLEISDIRTYEHERADKIRAEYLAKKPRGKSSYRMLEKKYGVSMATVAKIVKGTHWTQK